MELAAEGENHECACVCDRCKNGREIFLLPKDIAAIQADAIRHAAEEAEEKRKREAAFAEPTLLERIVAIRSKLADATVAMMKIDTDKLPHYPAGGHVGTDALNHLMQNLRAADREITTLIGQLEQHYPPGAL